LRSWEFFEQEPYPLSLDSLESLERWRDDVVRRVRKRYDDRVGDVTAVDESVGSTDPERSSLADVSLRTWYFCLVAGLSQMRERDELRREADPAALATGIIAAVEGGYLLARAARSVRPMELAFDMALEHVRYFAEPA
jgi:hypothetical protein